MTKKRVVDFLLALTGGAIALVGYFYIEDWYYWVVALGGGLLMLIFLILMVRDGRAGPAKGTDASTRAISIRARRSAS